MALMKVQEIERLVSIFWVQAAVNEDPTSCNKDCPSWLHGSKLYMPCNHQHRCFTPSPKPWNSFHLSSPDLQYLQEMDEDGFKQPVEGLSAGSVCEQGGDAKLRKYGSPFDGFSGMYRASVGEIADIKFHRDSIARRGAERAVKKG